MKDSQPREDLKKSRDRSFYDRIKGTVLAVGLGLGALVSGCTGINEYDVVGAGLANRDYATPKQTRAAGILGTLAGIEAQHRRDVDTAREGRSEVNVDVGSNEVNNEYSGYNPHNNSGGKLWQDEKGYWHFPKRKGEDY